MRRSCRSRSANMGVTLIEILIVLSILATLFGIGMVRIGAPNARLLGNDVKSQVQQARYEAIRRNRPIAVIYEPDTKRFVTRFDEASALVSSTCQGDTVLVEKRISDYRRMTVETELTNGLVWLPTGQGRDCSGSPLIDSTTIVSDGRATRTLEVSSGGKVTLR